MEIAKYKESWKCKLGSHDFSKWSVPKEKTNTRYAIEYQSCCCSRCSLTKERAV